jgi:outer membrane protein assembly factor BamB
MTGVLVVLVGVVTGVVVLRMDDGMEGPYGQFPGPLATRPPEKTPHPVASASWIEVPDWSSYGVLVYGGLAMGSAGPETATSDLYAISIASGRVYWHFDKPSRPLTLDRATGGLIAGTGHDIVAINAKSGQVRWSTSPGIGDVTQAVSAGDRGLLVFSDDAVAGVDPASGRTRWTARLSRECQRAAAFERPVVVDGTAAFLCGIHWVERQNLRRHVSERVGGQLTAFDVATGRRWTVKAGQLLPNGELFLGQGPQERLSVIVRASGDDGRGVLVMLDPMTGAVRARRDTPYVLNPVFADGVQIGRCPVGGGKVVVCGSDPHRGRRLWTDTPQQLVLPRNSAIETAITVTNGRAYVLMNEDVALSGTEDATQWLVVLDVRTGARLAQWQLEKGAPLRFSGPAPITDGVINLDTFPDDGSTGTDVASFLYAESPAAAKPRSLFPAPSRFDLISDTLKSVLT